MSYFILFITSFFFVFLRAFQQKNVTGFHYKMAAITSYFIAITEVTMVITVVNIGWEAMFITGTGGALGVVIAMKYHEDFIKIIESMFSRSTKKGKGALIDESR